MKIVASKYEFVVADLGTKWEVYDTIGGQAVHTAFKEGEPNYLDALLEKWGYDSEDYEVGSYDDLVPDWEALGFATEEEALAERYSRRRMALLSEIESSYESLLHKDT